MTAKITRRISFAIVSFVLLALLAACGAGGGDGGLLQQGRTYYTNGVRLETKWTADYKAFEQKYNTGLLTVLDQNKLADQCFDNVADTVHNAVAGLFDTGKGDTGAPTGNMDTQAFILALQLKPVSADLAEKCQDAKIAVMNQVQSWRSNSLDASLQLYDVQREYTNFLNDDIAKTTLNRFVTKYAPKFPDLGIDNSFVGFPTDNLSAETRDRSICDYYVAQHASNGIYAASWNSALRTCSLRRMAAKEFMERLMISAETSNRVDCGMDAGAFDTVNKDCTVGDPTPEQ